MPQALTAFAFLPGPWPPSNRLSNIDLGIIVFYLIGITLFGLSFRKRKDLRDHTSRALLIIALACTGWGLYGCASGTIKFRQLGTPAGAYTVTVTATGGAINHAASVTLTVQP